MAQALNALPDRQPSVAPQPREPRHEMARLALLHDEARETAILANLLGRTPYVAGTLLIASLATVLFERGSMPAAESATWLVLILIGAGAMARAFRRAIAQPFERGTLRGFASDLGAIAVYAGFAWGAGTFLALGPQTSPYVLAGFAAVVPAIVAATLRNRELALSFLAPTVALGAFAAVLRPLPEGPLAAAFVLIACAAVGAAIFWADRLFAPVPTAAKLADLQLSQP